MPQTVLESKLTYMLPCLICYTVSDDEEDQDDILDIEEKRVVLEVSPSVVALVSYSGMKFEFLNFTKMLWVR